MKLEQISLNVYTIRDFLTTAKDVAESFKKLREIGLKTIQISAMDQVDLDEVVKILDGEGLRCIATHENPTMIFNEPEKVIERQQKLGCNLGSYPYPVDEKLETLDDVKGLAARLNRAGEVLHKAGITLNYHNHHIEFRRFGGKTMLEILYEETDPRFLQAEIDTYWVQHGGGDPVRWCESLKGRLPIIHFKDYVINEKNEATFAEVGSGNLDFKRITAAAEASGCRWFAIEQDTCPGDPFESVKKSFNYMKDNLLCS